MLVAVLACHGDEPAPLAAPTRTPSLAPAAALAPTPAPAVAAPAPSIELLHAVPVTITVSSQVDNPAIKPGQLVDRDLATAWNSRTGDLVGAWIEIALPPGVVAKQLRMTAGNTGKGPRNADYFTMNVRTRLVTVHAKGHTASATLDIARRDLQPIDLPDLTGTLRITIDAIEPGTRRSWKEICVSELELWGAAPPSALHAGTPTVVVDPHVAADALCDEFADERRAYKPATPCDGCGTNVPGPPGCEVTVFDSFTPSPPWRHVATRCHTTDTHYEPWSCPLALDTAGWWFGPAVSHRAELVDATVRDVVPGGDPELVLRLRTGQLDQLVVCKTDRSCTAPRALGDSGWEATPSFARGKLVLTAARGAPPSDAIGTFDLDFKPAE